jgi:hypothetical protein
VEDDCLVLFFTAQPGNLSYGVKIPQARKLYENKGCVKVIEQYRQSELAKVTKKFSGLDKARIEEESKYQTKQRIFFGGLVLIAGVVIITMFGKRK